MKKDDNKKPIAAAQPKEQKKAEPVIKPAAKNTETHSKPAPKVEIKKSE